MLTNQGLQFTIHSNVSSYLRAVMERHCVSVVVTNVPPSLQELVGPVFAQQPLWVQTQNILDRVASYCTFEEQAGALRLVSRQFDASASIWIL